MNKTPLCTVIFVCSLMLNAFLIGLMISNHCQPQVRHKRVDRMEQAAQDLDPAYRDKVQAVLAKNREKMDTRMEAMGNNFDRITAALTAPKFDEAKLKAVHNDIARSDNAMKDSMLATATAIAKILPDSERIKFFRETAPDHPKGPHGKDK